MQGPSRNAALPTSSFAFKSGRSGSKIGPYSQLGHRTGRVRRMGPKLPARYAGECTTVACRRPVARRQQFSEKWMTCSLRHCASILIRRMSLDRVLGCAAWLRWSLWRRRDHEPAAICESGGGVVRNGRSRGLGRHLACGLRFGRHREPPARCQSRTAAHRLSPPTPSSRTHRRRPQWATASPLSANVDVATAAESVTGTATDMKPASHEPESIVEAALTDSSQMPPPESPPVQVATASTSDPVPNDVKEAASSVEILDECLVAGRLHRPISVGALPTDAQGGHHQGA